jgi:hypothetical protein
MKAVLMYHRKKIALNTVLGFIRVSFVLRLYLILTIYDETENENKK